MAPNEFDDYLLELVSLPHQRLQGEWVVLGSVMWLPLL